MSAHALLLQLCNAGITLSAEGDALSVAPRELLTDSMRAAIRTHKPALLKALGPQTSPVIESATVPGDTVDDDRIVCTECRHFRSHGMQCLNRWVAGMPLELGADLAMKPQRCPGFCAARHAN